MNAPMPTQAAELRTRATELRLHGLLAHWADVMADPEAASRVAQWLDWETQERSRRSLERRLREAHIGQFKPLADFDWSWPKRCDRAAIEALMASTSSGRPATSSSSALPVPARARSSSTSSPPGSRADARARPSARPRPGSSRRPSPAGRWWSTSWTRRAIPTSSARCAQG